MWGEVSVYLNGVVDDAQQTGEVLALAFLGHSDGKTGGFVEKVDHAPHDVYLGLLDETVLKAERRGSIG